MACPYFMPVEKFQNGAWPHPGRLPLGGGWRGHCTAPGHEGQVPSQSALESFCNLGYASACSWSPQERRWDSVRFAVTAPEVVKPKTPISLTAPARVLQLRYVCERNHLPVEHGGLEFDLSKVEWLRRHQDERVQKMAECFLESYLTKEGAKPLPAIQTAS